ncbi:RNA polymerase subunit sigma-70 [Sphingomonas sp. Leaf407]|uniref:sigma-70 family RNA polymerase sigma factor n=1 Tax=unclassified Sphingomonas TaxID=196159 RepID=UPI0007009040|nr:MULTISPECIES: sigma-70 family RNA polymerase sigma factor [unclassified Sphingomonas]KQN40799.1 RNA polymerase subunit sigma-70 [Sphingomonas sp. Leaf42]KQT30154.1 RNA polymerase subunit sigma-70 [Sphingomonas sp. Leaf407]
MSGTAAALTAGYARLLAYARKRLRDPDQAEEVVQETMLRVIEQDRRQTIEQPLAYAFRVADSVVYAGARRDGRAGEPVDPDLVCAAPLPDATLDYRQRLARFETVLATLPAQRRTVFVKRHIEGKSRGEIAEELGIGIEAVKKHLVRAMIDLAAVADALDLGQ